MKGRRNVGRGYSKEQGEKKEDKRLGPRRKTKSRERGGRVERREWEVKREETGWKEKRAKWKEERGN